MDADAQRHLWDASTVWAPDFPRKASNERVVQAWVESRATLVDSLRHAAEAGQPGYISTYAFPRGHSTDGNIPAVNGIFIDLDVTGENYNPDTDDGDLDAWTRDMSALLARARMIAKALIEADRTENFLVSLSGHKGVHLDLVFPTVSPNEGSFHQFKNGLSAYGDEVVAWLRDISGGVDIDPWVDVNSSDLGRLRRMPNTPHNGTNHVPETKWCVPVTLAELAEMYPDDYLAYTDGPRPLPSGVTRNPSARAGQLVVQRIRTASSSEYSNGSVSRFNPRAVNAYKEASNDELELADIKFLTSNKPCVWAFRDRADGYQHGDASRQMELNVMARLIELRVPIDVMCEFFAPIEGYDEDYTRALIEDLIGRGDGGYNSFNCETITDRAPQFCHGMDCGVYRRNDDLRV